MTIEEMKQYNGKDGKPAYVACKGKIYDVSKSSFWKDGAHMGRFNAGEDLTEEIAKAPHGDKILARMPIVGEIEKAEEKSSGSIKKITLEELKKYNGKDGQPAYVACNGKVYDLSKSDFWTGGNHMGRFNAGEDLSSSIGLSPHGEANLFRYPVVAELTNEKEKKEEKKEEIKKENNPEMEKMIKYQKMYAKLHPHPIMVHFPMGMFPLAFFLMIIGYFLDSPYFNFASIVSMVFATVFAAPAILSGVLSLYVNYFWHTNVYLKRKIAFSIILLAVGIYASAVGILYAYNTICPHGAISAVHEHLSIGYIAASALIMPIIMIIGYSGGKITWPDA